MESTILTIAIPTYNRNELLKRSVDILLLQINEKVSIVVYDNCSDVPVSDTLHYVQNPNFRIVRNKHNIGGSANIIRCIENCETQWLWILGDDDPPAYDAIHTILTDIELNSGCAYINYKSEGLAEDRNKDFYAEGVKDLITKLDHFGNLLFISVGIYNLSKLKLDFRTTYQFLYSFAPQIVFLFKGIGSEKKVLFTSKKILDYSLYNGWDNETWPWLYMSLSFPILYESVLHLDDKYRKMLAKHILTHVRSSRYIYMLLETRYADYPVGSKLFLLNQIFSRSIMATNYKRIIAYLMCYVKLYFKYKVLKKNRPARERIIEDSRI